MFVTDMDLAVVGVTTTAAPDGRISSTSETSRSAAASSAS